MGRSHPDQLVTALSKYLKAPNAPVLRFTLKRGGLWQPQFAKAHSRRAKREVRQQLEAQAANKGHQQVYPLLARLKTNEKEETLRLNCETRPGKGTSMLQSLLGVFRVNFFKKKGDQEKIEGLKGPTKADPNSKSSLKRKQKNIRNQERRNKRLQIRRQKRAQQRVAK